MSDLMVFVITLAIAISLVHIIKNIYVAIAKKRMQISKEIDIPLPKNEKLNDKIISVNNLLVDEVKIAVQNFTNQYQEKKMLKLRPISKISTISSSESVITFPYDIDFEIFCYMINGLIYSNQNKKYNNNVKAWCTVKNTDNWINDIYDNKKAMIFIDKNDAEYDNVNLAFENDENCKIGFSMDANLYKLDEILMKYEKPIFDNSDLKKYDSKLIK